MSEIKERQERKKSFQSVSLEEVERLYTPEDVADIDFERDIASPGEFPYTRGIHETGYRGKLWTMRQFAGFSTPEETNNRFKYLLEQGQTGLSVAYDLPTLMGYDADSPLSEGEVGKCGVAVSSLADMEVLFDGIPLEQVTVSQTINAPASVLLAMYLVVAEKQGARWDKISGTLQNDILKEYIAQKEWIYPIKPAMKLVIDTFAFCTEHVPRYNPVSVSGYHIREAGATAVQELAFTLRDGIEYVAWGVESGLDVDRFVPRMSFFFNAHNDFFEEIAKYRAARRIWAREMKRRFGSNYERTLQMRFHTQTAGVSLTVQQPLNNIVRVAIQALAGVLGGTNSLHTDAYDEALALPTDRAALIALRTQQIIAEETGVANTVDPLGGSYFLESLTDKMEQEALDYFRKIVRRANSADFLDTREAAADAPYVSSALVWLGSYYLEGIPGSDVKPNPKIALHLFTDAAYNYGDPNAEYNLARMYLDGTDVTKNTALAVRWLNLAAAKGHAPSRALLGHILFKGEIVPRQAERGLMLMMLARQQAEKSGLASDKWMIDLDEKALAEATAEQRSGALSFLDRWLKAKAEK